MSTVESRVVVPRNGVACLCAARDGQWEVLSEAPGEPDARHVVSEDGRYLAAMDRGNTRAGLFELLLDAPWIRETLPLAPLPNGCVGHATLPMGDGLFVGGNGPNHEALWQRTAAAESNWMTVPLPQEIMKRGKAVDGLHVLGDTLVVVDDIVTPKWLLLYGLSNPGMPVHRNTIRLPSHTTYERIIYSSLGASGLWCLSKGINHGVASTHLWRLSVPDFKQEAHWAANDVRPSSFPSMFDAPPASEDTRAAMDCLLSCLAVVEVDGAILLACGGKRLGMIALRDGPSHIEDLQFLETPGFYSIDGLVLPAPWDGQGVFMVGEDKSGAMNSTWLPSSQLAPHRDP